MSRSRASNQTTTRTPTPTSPHTAQATTPQHLPGPGAEPAGRSTRWVGVLVGTRASPLGRAGPGQCWSGAVSPPAVTGPLRPAAGVPDVAWLAPPVRPSGPSGVDPLEGDGHALAAGDAEGGQPAAGALALELVDDGPDDAGAGHADRVAEGDGAAVDVGPLPVELELAVAGQDLGRERLVDLDHVDLGERPAELGQQLLGGRDNPPAHDVRVDPGAGPAGDPGQRAEPLGPGRLLGHDHQGGGTVADPRGVAGGDRSRVAEHRLELGQRLKGGARPGVLVALDRDRPAPGVEGVDGDDLVGEAARVPGLARPLLG